MKTVNTQAFTSFHLPAFSLLLRSTSSRFDNKGKEKFTLFQICQVLLLCRSHAVSRDPSHHFTWCDHFRTNWQTKKTIQFCCNATDQVLPPVRTPVSRVSPCRVSQIAQTERWKKYLMNKKNYLKFEHKQSNKTRTTLVKIIVVIGIIIYENKPRHVAWLSVWLPTHSQIADTCTHFAFACVSQSHSHTPHPYRMLEALL